MEPLAHQLLATLAQHRTASTAQLHVPPRPTTPAKAAPSERDLPSTCPATHPPSHRRRAHGPGPP
ncbi:hypothetical protein [Streptomyces gilvus]|uniref:hypothetical protein n=1 Tax=Streptomyces gilvus TaxID=2920937 RepID=UPI001F10352D|nr:hypothetical protein [Streptomyces sp. CME 23]MCH5677296.1 hypothetical protein [Streptomyces sp. CME 23]